MQLNSRCRRLQPARPCTLQELPAAWLFSMLAAASKTHDQIRLFRTCKRLKQLVLHDRLAVLTLFSSPQRFENEVVGLCMLEATPGAHAHLKLKVVKMEDDSEQFLIQKVLLFAASHSKGLLKGVPRTSAWQLQVITRLDLISEVGSLDWDQKMLDFMAETCPNLRALKLEGLVVQGSTQLPETKTVFVNLQKLVIDRVVLQQPAHMFMHRLKFWMPKLVVLDISTSDTQQFEEGGGFRGVLDMHSPQLQSVSIDLEECTWELPWSPDCTDCTLLQHLDMQQLVIEGDQVLQALLYAAPNLATVKLFTIQGLGISYAQIPCYWEDLSLWHLYIADLALLPLSHCATLTCMEEVHVYWQDGPVPTLQQLETAASAVLQAGGLQFSCPLGSIKLHLNTNELSHVAAVAPLLQNPCDQMDLDWSSIDGRAPPKERLEVLAVIGKHLQCNKFRLVFDQCEGQAEPVLQLPKLLPQVQCFILDAVTGLSAQHLTELCRTATRPFTIHLGPQTCPSAQALLQDIMRQEGHQLVTIIIQPECDEAVPSSPDAGSETDTEPDPPCCSLGQLLLKHT